MKFYIVGPGYAEKQLVEALDFQVVATIEEADVLLFTGGADISPALYNQPKHHSVWPQDYRDEMEVKAFNKGRELDKAFFGICRGAQLLCALAGGTLYQDVSNHHSNHNMILPSGAKIRTTSIHHQMMRLPEGAIMEAWAEEGTSGTYWDHESASFKNTKIEAEYSVEAAYFPNIKGFGVQGHPEYQLNTLDYHPFRKFVRNKLLEHFGDVAEDTPETNFTLAEKI